MEEKKYDDSIYNITPIDNNESYKQDNASGANETLNSQNLFYTDIIGIPNWGIDNFIKERLKFQSYGLNSNNLSRFSDPGIFFYKVFFNFNTGYGLFGSILYGSDNNKAKEENTAYQYLTNNINSGRLGTNYTKVLKKKRDSLEKFCKLLNYLVTECPWFFKEVTGLEGAINYDFSEIINNDREINLTFNQDAIDMRISTLFDLYKDACYDFTNFKEIIPENLRKFDMCIILFNPPIIGMNLQTYPYINSNLNIYESAPNNASKLSGELKQGNLSFRCLILKNCEFKLKGINNFPSTIKNDTGFIIENSVSINYQRSYIYNLNNELNIKTIDGLFYQEPESEE